MNKEILLLLFKRAFSSVIILFLLTSFIFILVRISPGGPEQKYLSPKLSPKLAEHVKESYQLDKPISVQYFNFIGNTLKGDLGISYNYRLDVVKVIGEFLPFTIIFSLISFSIQIFFSLLLAVKSIQKINGFLDKTLNKASLIIYATPAFVVGVFLIFIFSAQINLFPSSGLKSIYFDDYNFVGKLTDYFLHLTLPIITLSLGGTAIFYKYIRENMEEILNKNFVLNLRANGMEEKEILKKHIIPNALNPLISVAGIELGILFGGALITEVIFGLPGMGRLTIDAILSRDYPLVIGCSFFAGALVIITNFIADVVKILIDKRSAKEIIN